MLENKKISIIVPIFNAEKYLDRCINSILCQTYDNIELILINDGSSDGSLRICEKANDQRIIIINQKNHGVSYSRNRGIDISTGEYIVFVDADDMLPRDSLEKRVEALGNNEIMISRFLRIDEKDIPIGEMEKCPKEYWSKQVALQRLFDKRDIGYQGYLWNKTFLSSIINKYQIRFNEAISYNEDRLFLLQYILHCETVKLNNDIVYWYRINSDSAMSLFTSQRTDQKCEKYMSEFVAFDLMKNYLKGQFNDTYVECCVDAFQASITHLKITDSSSPILKKKLQYERNKNLFEIINPFNSGIKNSMHLFLCLIWNQLKIILRRIKKFVWI